MKVTLFYRLSGCPRRNKRTVKVVRAIVAGHERAAIPGCGAHATIKGGLVRLIVPAQLAESANFWVEQSLFRGWDPATEQMWDLRTLNHLTLIWRCGAILVPQDAPNGGYGLRNGGPKTASSSVIPQAKCTRIKVAP